MATSDSRAAAAREHHRLATGLTGQAAQHREVRDRLVRTLRDEGWPYARIAAETTISVELVAKILRKGWGSPT